MSLRVWLPLTGNLENKGLLPLTSSSNVGAVINSNGKIGSCYSFNGSNQRIEFRHDKTVWNNKEISICMWYKYLEGNTACTMVDIAADLCLAYTYNSSQIKFGYWRAYSNNGTRTGDSGSGNYHDASQWHHVVLTCDHSINKIYVDGILDSTFDRSSKYTTNWTPLLGANYNIIMLAKSAGSNPYGSGYLNDVRIYDHALSEKEVKEIAKGLVLHYKLNDINHTYQGVNILPNSDLMQLGASDASIGRWRLAGTSNMTRTRVLIEKNIYGFENSGIQTANDGSCYGIDSFPLTGNAVYCISMKARKISGNGDAFAGFHVYSISQEIAGSHTKVDKGYRVTPLTNEWTTCWYIVKTNASASRNIYIGVTTGDTEVITQMCQVKIQQVYTIGNNELVEDVSGYNYNGTIVNNIAITTDTPKYNSCANYLDNTDGIIIRNIPLNIFNDENTISFWIKPNGENGARSIYCSSYGGTSYSIEKGANNKLRVWWAGSPDKYATIFTILDDEWQHICIVKLKNKTEILLYKNGEFIETLTGTFSDKVWSGTYYLGRDYRTDATSYIGKMSDFRIYCTALSAEDIKELYQTSASIDDKQNFYGREFSDTLFDTTSITQAGIILADNFVEDTVAAIKEDKSIESNCFYEY